MGAAYGIHTSQKDKFYQRLAEVAGSKHPNARNLGKQALLVILFMIGSRDVCMP